MAPGASGLGGEALVLVGQTWLGQPLLLNVGGTIDPADDAAGGRPRGLLAGLDMNYDIDDNQLFPFSGRWARFGSWRP